MIDGWWVDDKCMASDVWSPSLLLTHIGRDDKHAH